MKHFFVARIHCAFLILLAGASGRAASAPRGLVPCADDSARQARSAEKLKALYSADQADYRKELGEHPDRPLDEKKLFAMAANDLERRRQVAALLADGCFKTAADYASAAMIFQHGNSPDHFMQAFIWARKSVELGDASQKSVVAIAIDRYLVSIGHRQLFATQFRKESTGLCTCLEPIEETFPEATRKEYRGDALGEARKRLAAANRGHECAATYCRRELKPTTKDMALGVW